MAVLLNLFFNDYGLPSGYAWVFLAFVFVVIIIIIIQASYADDDVPALKVLTIIALFFYPVLFSEFNESIRAYTYQWFGHPKG